jgi:hypothetical protein
MELAMRYVMTLMMLLIVAPCLAQTQAERAARGRAALSVIGPTARDIHNMTQQQQQDMICQSVRDKIELQKDMEAAGSSGLYNMTALTHIERQQCIDVETRQYRP